MKQYTVDYFIKKFEAIPEEKWTTGIYTDKEKRHCALGHCGITPMSSILKESEGKELHFLFLEELDLQVVYVNDGVYNAYQQPTPKQRVLAALYDIKAKQSPKYQDITKEIASLPIEQDRVDVILKKETV